MTTTAEALEAAHARLELEALTDALTVDGKVELDDGRHATTMGVLAAIDDATTSRDQAAGSSLTSHRAPARLGAVALLGDVDRAVGTTRRRTTREHAVRAWAAEAMSASDLGLLADAVELARDWTQRASTLLEPRRFVALRGTTCPRCGARDVVIDGTAGERIIGPALRADLRRGEVGCWSTDCATVWRPEQLHHLAAVLDQQALEVLAVE